MIGNTCDELLILINETYYFCGNTDITVCYFQADKPTVQQVYILFKKKILLIEKNVNRSHDYFIKKSSVKPLLYGFCIPPAPVSREDTVQSLFVVDKMTVFHCESLETSIVFKQNTNIPVPVSDAVTSSVSHTRSFRRAR